MGVRESWLTVIGFAVIIAVIAVVITRDDDNRISDKFASVPNSEKAVALVSNRRYFDRALATAENLRKIGEWDGDIVLVIGDDLNHGLEMFDKNLFNHVVYAPDVDKKVAKGTSRRPRFQFQKMIVFSPFFTKWKQILYIDVGMKIKESIAPLLKFPGSKPIVFPYDGAYQEDGTHAFSPGNGPGCLLSQFEKGTDFGKYKGDVKSFQTTMFMIRDTSVLERHDFVGEIVKLSHKHPTFITNEQALLNLWAQDNPDEWEWLTRQKHKGRHLYTFMDYCDGRPSKNIIHKYCNA